MKMPTLAVPPSIVRSASSTAEFAGIALITCEILAAGSSAASDEGSDVAESATGATRAIAVMNGNMFFMVLTLRLQVNFKSKGKFQENCERFPWRSARLV